MAACCEGPMVEVCCQVSREILRWHYTTMRMLHAEAEDMCIDPASAATITRVLASRAPVPLKLRGF
jgi:hypothetical protein